MWCELALQLICRFDQRFAGDADRLLRFLDTRDPLVELGEPLFDGRRIAGLLFQGLCLGTKAGDPVDLRLEPSVERGESLAQTRCPLYLVRKFAVAVAVLFVQPSPLIDLPLQ